METSDPDTALGGSFMPSHSPNHVTAVQVSRPHSLEIVCMVRSVCIQDPWQWTLRLHVLHMVDLADLVSLTLDSIHAFEAALHRKHMTRHAVWFRDGVCASYSAAQTKMQRLARASPFCTPLAQCGWRHGKIQLCFASCKLPSRPTVFENNVVL